MRRRDEHKIFDVIIVAVFSDLSFMKCSNWIKHHWRNVGRICEADSVPQNSYQKILKMSMKQVRWLCKSDLKLEQMLKTLDVHLSNIKSNMELWWKSNRILKSLPFCLISQMHVLNGSLDLMSSKVAWVTILDSLELNFEVDSRL